MPNIRRITKEELLKIDPHLQIKHPKVVLAEIFKIEAKKFLHGAGFQSERDLFIGCLFAFYCRKLQNREWLIQRISDPPDFNLTAVTDRPIKEKPFDYAEVEIVELTDRIKTLSEAIQIIKSRKIDRPYALNRGTVLLIFINSSQGPNWSYGFGKFFRNSGDKYSEVFAVYLLRSDSVASFIYEVKAIRPYGYKETLSLNDELRRKMIWHPLLEKFAVKVE